MRIALRDGAYKTRSIIAGAQRCVNLYAEQNLSPASYATLQTQGARWSAGLRWRRGLDVGQPLSAEASAQLDMQARWDIAARAAWAGAAAPLPPLA